MAAPETSAYVLAIADSIALPNSRLLTGDNDTGIHVDIGGGGGDITIKTVGSLLSLATASTSGIYTYNANTKTFVGGGISCPDGSIVVVNGTMSPLVNGGATTISVQPNSMLQNINVEQDGDLKATSSTLNFVPGTGIVLEIDEVDGVAVLDLSIDEAGLGTVREVNMTSTYSDLVFTGTGEPDEEGVLNITVDLPALGNTNDVLTITSGGVAWQANAGAADWSLYNAKQDVNMTQEDGPDAGSYGFYNLGVTGVISWGATVGASPRLYATGVGVGDQRYIAATVGESTENASGYVVLTNSIPGAGEGAPYGQIGNLLYGIGNTGPDGVFMYTDLAAPSDPGEFELRADGSTQLPSWKPLGQGVVTLGNLSAPLNWGNGSAFVADPNVTTNTIIVVAPLAYITTPGGVKPGIQDPKGPFSVFVNTADNSPAGFGLGFVIQGDTSAGVAGDDGTDVAYYVVKY